MTTPDNTDSQLRRHIKAAVDQKEYGIDSTTVADTIMLLIAASNKALLSDLKGWIDRNHYHPVTESDRWVQASGEIMLEVDSRVAKLDTERHQHKWENVLLLSMPPQRRCETCGHTEFVKSTEGADHE